ncbi:hypothetical protein [Paenibacillus apii]|nr:hypothetical protein [Paenibacillus apii]
MKLEEHFEPFPELETKRTTLRPIDYSDLNDMLHRRLAHGE